VGVQVNTPPHLALGERGIVGDNVVAYQLMFDPNYHPEDYPGRQIEDLIAGRIDVALVWGPIAGYFQKKKGAESLVLVPIEGTGEKTAVGKAAAGKVAADEGAAKGLPFAFDISMGVRKKNTELEARLEQALERKQGEIKAILEDFGVPLLPLAASAPGGGTKAPDGPARDKKVKR